MNVPRRSPAIELILTLVFASVVSLALYGYNMHQAGGMVFSYLPWNLFLAWLPLGLAIWLVKVLQRELWSSWTALLISLAWLAFLPNSFYMISDFIHLVDVRPDRLLYTVVMFSSFVFTGVLLGFSSLYLVHQELRKRFTSRGAAGWVGVTLLICSMAIYIGRDLRWNTWDLVFNPAGLLFDISDRVIHPGAPQLLSTVVSFFVLLTTMYAVVWQSARLVSHTARRR